MALKEGNIDGATAKRVSDKSGFFPKENIKTMLKATILYCFFLRNVWQHWKEESLQTVIKPKETR